MARTRRIRKPYKVGEVPFPITYTFKDDDGNAIDLTGYTAAVVFELNGVETEVAATVAPDQVADRGEATFSWLDGDLDEPGSGSIEWWAGNGTNRIAGDTFIFRVARAVATTAPAL